MHSNGSTKYACSYVCIIHNRTLTQTHIHTHAFSVINICNWQSEKFIEFTATGRVTYIHCAVQESIKFGSKAGVTTEAYGLSGLHMRVRRIKMSMTTFNQHQQLLKI